MKHYPASYIILLMWNDSDSRRMFDVEGLVVSHDDKGDLWVVNFHVEEIYSFGLAFDAPVIHQRDSCLEYNFILWIEILYIFAHRPGK